MHQYSPEVAADLAVRLRRLEGQVRGIQRMLDERRDCREVVQQLMAVRSAAHRTALELVRHSAEHCLNDEERPQADTIRELVDILVRM